MRILLIDDEITFRRALSMAMSRSGYDIMEVASAYDALDILNISEIDVIVVDWNMPGINGERFLTILEERQIDIPIMILSSQSGLSQISNLIRKNNCRIIGKDNAVGDIIENVNELYNEYVFN